MRVGRVAAILAAASAFLSGCSKSDLDRCIDSQMADWQQKEQSYEEELKNYKPPAEPQPAVNLGNGLAIDPSMWPAFSSPGTKEEAEARANLQCGKVYAKHD